MNNSYALLSYDQGLIQQVRNWAYSSSTNYRVESKLLNEARREAIAAMGALQKEYHLENN